MTHLTLTSLPYEPSPLGYFSKLKDEPGAVLLDSGKPHSATGRFDILSSQPLCTLKVQPNGLEWSADAPAHLTHVQDIHTAQKALLALVEHSVPDDMEDLPFSGGIIGYWSYEFARTLQALPLKEDPSVTWPWAMLGAYDWALVLDHHEKCATLIAPETKRHERHQMLSRPAHTRQRPSFHCTTPFAPEWTRADYGVAFQQVQAYLSAGDCYQINLTQRFSAHTEGDGFEAYQRLRAATPTPFSGYLDWGDGALMSLSPERFIRCSERTLMAQPIKGTRPRGATPEEDRQLALELEASLKDKAENVMIVDLLRNDLGRVSAPGTVTVPKLMALESYANVHHLVSTITGQLDSSKDALDALMAAFPGGSITGAPKHRAIEIIDELEPVFRAPYCGSLGYIDTRGNMDTSIMIRTALMQKGRVHLWGGGGIVADSVEEEEYAESIAKIRHLMNALESET
ncbi:aminodeoxychorismate synthase component I [Larsenimonas suaedae]|uniref:aminodeoxychorismate synthase n=1 Tax=Larsenimonas suaedae TaxID=1851019 RepID=A0ABU1GXS6_9GAMM|nr:aminodeoxychorismate synthase component I [Larsenimonas suaedae]MCM2972758.1 aminodeoxychorismate synthase component I [Larsenimonas suaedae]MDR5896857.1 aminodeoxychorismate synthase component I [Larsenimonas suaedae]